MHWILKNKMGWELKFLPAYTPELNMIELFWSTAKHIYKEK
jgi:transposase